MVPYLNSIIIMEVLGLVNIQTISLETKKPNILSLMVIAMDIKLQFNNLVTLVACKKFCSCLF